MANVHTYSEWRCRAGYCAGYSRYPHAVEQQSYSTSLDMLTTPSLATSPRTTEDDFTEEEIHRVKDDSSRRVREVHRRFGDRNMAGFLRDFGFQVEGGWNPSQQTFDKQKKLGLVMSHPDKQRNKPFRERCLAEAVFKELNEWEYKPAIDRPHFGFGSIAPTGQSSSPAPTSGLPKHNRTPSYGSMHGGLGYGQSSLGYQNSRSSLEIASRLSRRSSDPRVSYSRMNTQH
uniref:Uncharacterized protein n=1 Tax=Tetraselmis chuii TaxID=63592 RepID=A0A6U1JHK8_9CHLO|mmetsp:Transcript_37530/g.67219  ORF Transcript_37530/g.67219 Transcript_37530/m.67219 type:complete len:230 (+) Transcript_37530:319-1008(+)|eukprot:CAMPEP_0177775122 /NCGR_PEP_ID=MMETSP0491_2-20121128/13912_1 /TAXON_ID=63592 /ORGANISM="Tetraselmis chuii, Strain PLY429" /LENGTH=229 /DNA_ID=CAMNT_0019293627 /DNA_START=186 /DNA_END=875 /DNA_ORIENTATION=-